MTAVRSRHLHLLAGPLLAILCLAMLPATGTTSGGQALSLPLETRLTIAATLWMAWWWLSEPLPLPATSLIPACLFPLLGVADLDAALAPYADPLLFLFLGGFVLAAAIEKWNLHRRFAFSLMRLSGGHAGRLVLAMMVATAFISFWLSNTATAVLMFPVALSLARHEAAAPALRKCLVLGVAWSATIGGMGTLIGTPPNVFVSSFLHSQYRITLDFGTWLVIGMPMVVVILPLTYWLMTRWFFPIRDQRLALPTAAPEEVSWRWAHLSPPARTTLMVFLAAALAWMLRLPLTKLEVAGMRPLAALSDAGIALAAALALFIFPLGLGRPATLDWEDTRRLPWGTLLLFGGGLSLAAAIDANGVDDLLGAALSGLPTLPRPAVIAVIAASVIFVSEVASNIATAAALTPLLAAAAPALGLSVVDAAVVAGLSASSAYMMPVGTAANALAHGSGLVSTRDMASVGLCMNLASVALITTLCTYLLPGLL